MKVVNFSVLTLLSFNTPCYGRSLLEAISFFPQLSNFTTLMTDNPDLAGALLTSKTSSLTTEITVLVPDDSAFQKVASIYKVPMSELEVQQLEPFLYYQLLVGRVTSDNFAAPKGITVPTLLTGSQFNNRSGGEALGSDGADGNVHNGQVVFMQGKNSGGNSKRFSVRQLGSPGAIAQGGLGHQINLTAVDGIWDGGYFQIVDKFLDLPLNCTDSLRRWNQTSVSQALQRTTLGPILDTTRNVTCFSPDDQAFLDAGIDANTAGVSDLQHALLFHTITEPLYSSLLQDGQTYKTFTNDTIHITVKQGEIFVNNAKIVHPNVITNNGVMHVLDQVIMPLNTTANATATLAGTPSATGSGVSSSASSTNIGSNLQIPAGSSMGIVVLLSMLVGGTFV